MPVHRIILLLSLSALIFLPGCRDGCECGRPAAPSSTNPPARTAVAPAKAPALVAIPASHLVSLKDSKVPQVTGAWTGRWESEGHKGHDGDLKCEAVETGPQKWTATFSADFGGAKSYLLKLEGAPGDGAVLFGGKVDLGKDNGIFTWSGRATESEFNGRYEGEVDTGKFSLTRPK